MKYHQISQLPFFNTNIPCVPFQFLVFIAYANHAKFSHLFFTIRKTALMPFFLFLLAVAPDVIAWFIPGLTFSFLLIFLEVIENRIFFWRISPNFVFFNRDGVLKLTAWLVVRAVLSWLTACWWIIMQMTHLYTNTNPKPYAGTVIRNSSVHEETL